MSTFWRVPFDGAPATFTRDGEPGAREILLSLETTFEGDGFGEQLHIHPVTIVTARYSGMIEGGYWLCLPTRFNELNSPFWKDWNTSDLECMMFWNRAKREEWPIGYGSHPTEAYLDLISRVSRLAGAA